MTVEEKDSVDGIGSLKNDDNNNNNYNNVAANAATEKLLGSSVEAVP